MSTLQSVPPPAPLKKTRPPKSALTNRGFSVLKSEYTDQQLGRWKEALTVRPFVNSDYGPPPPSFKVFLESPRKLYFPKHYAVHKVGEPEHVKHCEGEECEFEFAGEMRKAQLPVIKAFLDSCDTDQPYQKASRGGIISVPCGFGKTVLALYLAARLGRKTLVIVHKEFLVSQWRERIEQYLPGTKVGCIQGKKLEIEGCDIVIGMLQSISMKDYPDSMFDCFGFCIVDECHHIAAEVFSRSLPRVNSTFMLGLSATPKRKDGLSKVFEWYLGPYVYIDKSITETRPVEATVISYWNGDMRYSRDVTIGMKLCVPKMLNNLCGFERRTALIVRILQRVAADPRRCFLVLSDRIQHLRDIHQGLATLGITDTGFYIGGMKEKARKESESKQIILGTFSMSSEGMDIPTLNTLFLVSPKSDIEQSVGRILRRDHGDLVPHVYDLVDNFSVFRNQAAKRRKFYERKGYQLHLSQALDDKGATLEELTNSCFDVTTIANKKGATGPKGTKEPKGPPKKRSVCQLLALTDDDED